MRKALAVWLALLPVSFFISSYQFCFIIPAERGIFQYLFVAWLSITMMVMVFSMAVGVWIGDEDGGAK